MLRSIEAYLLGLPYSKALTRTPIHLGKSFLFLWLKTTVQGRAVQGRAGQCKSRAVEEQGSGVEEQGRGVGRAKVTLCPITSILRLDPILGPRELPSMRSMLHRS